MASPSILLSCSKKVLILLLFFIIILPAYTQKLTRSVNIENITGKLKKAPHDSVKIHLYHQLAHIYYDSSITKTLEYEYKALSLCRKIKNAKKEVETLMRIGEYHMRNNNYKQSACVFNSCIQNLKPHISSEQLVKIYFSLGASYDILCLFDSAEIYFNKAYLLNITVRDRKLEHKIQINLGNMDFKNNDVTAALEHYIKALEIAKELKDDVLVGMSYLCIATYYHNLADYDNELIYLKKGISIARRTNKKEDIAYAYLMLGALYTEQEKYNEAINAYKKSMNLYSQCNGFLDYIVEINLRLGILCYKQGNKQLTIVKYNNVLELERKLEVFYYSAYAYCNLGEVYFVLEQYDKSIMYLDSALVLATEQNLINVEMESHKTLSSVYEMNNMNDKALVHYKKYFFLKDSLNQIIQKKEAKELLAKYQTKEKEDEIRALNAENRVKNIQLYSIVGFTVLSLILLLLIFNRYKLSIKSRKKLEELNQIKSRFFANITHEFKTPLSLIMTPLQSQIETTADSSEKQKLSMMYRNANRLNILINQLLDLSKIETGNMALNISENNMPAVLNVFYSNFKSIARSKKIDFLLNIKNTAGIGYFDIDKLEKIIYNLLSNAFKFTPRNGKVSMQANITPKYLTIKICDTGKGIPADKISLVFERFYMIDSSFTRNNAGSGIGLSLSKELVEIHKGKLTVESIEGKGSIFTVIIPISKEAYKQELISENKAEINNSSIKVLQENDFITSSSKQVINDTELPLIMIAEDNEDMLIFISQLLKKNYNIITSANGNEAWNKILTLIPDIVISDIMMPGMDGNTLCEKIKTQVPTSHIPVILLTAKTDQKSRIEGIEKGADVYLTKPFDSKELLACIQNLLNKKARLHQLFNENKSSFTERSELSGEDSRFFEKFMLVLKENYHNAQLGVDWISNEMGMSRMQLNRKIKALTDISPGEYLRLYRLDKAKTLLQVKGAQIGEVAFRVGFTNPSNFSKIFKYYSGYTPSEYISSNTQTIEIS